MIFSMHIPKCGGRSLEHVLRLQDQLTVFFIDDASHAVDHPQAERERTMKKQQLEKMRQRGELDVDIFYGHYNFDTIKDLTTEKVFTIFVRHPAQRIQSAWSFLQRVKDEEWAVGNVHVEFMREFQSIEDYIQCPFYANSFQNMLGPLLPDDFAFIGMQEDFSASLTRYLSFIGVTGTFDVPNLNLNPTPSYDDSARMIRLIRDHNAFEFEFYEECQRRNQR